MIRRYCKVFVEGGRVRRSFEKVATTAGTYVCHTDVCIHFVVCTHTYTAICARTHMYVHTYSMCQHTHTHTHMQYSTHLEP